MKKYYYRLINWIAYLLVCLSRIKPKVKKLEAKTLKNHYEAFIHPFGRYVGGIEGITGLGIDEKQAIKAFYESLQDYYYNKIKKGINSFVIYLGSSGFTNWLLLIIILLLLVK